VSSSPSAPPPPNYGPIADASRQASERQYEISRDQLDWAKTQYNDAKPFTDRVKTSLLDQLDTNTATAKKDRARYEDIFQPLEDSLANDAETYASPERMAQMRGRAVASVAQQFDVAGEAAKRQLESFGVDPTATRFAALDVGTKLAKASAGAAAANQSDLAVEDRGRALRSEAINVGKGYPGAIAGQYGTGAGAGTGGVGAQNSTYSAFSPALGNPTAWQGLGNQSVGTWGQTLNNAYQSQIAGYNAQNNQSSGVGSALGLIGGMAAQKGMSMFLEDGGVIPEDAAGLPGGVPIPSAIPTGVSPSGGQETDDVTARVNVGEMIVPKEAVQWYGEKFFQNLIAKVEKEKAGAPAKPQMKQAIPSAPTYASPGASMAA